MKIQYMVSLKRLGLILLCLMIIDTDLQAQTPNGSLRSNGVPVAVPGAYANAKVNYIRTWTPSMPITDSAVVTAAARTVKEVKQTTQYMDGLGRPIQTVGKGMSGGIDTLAAGGKDVVSMKTYDVFGREEFQYLPYVQQSGNTSDGNFKTSPFSSQAAFYQSAALNPGASGEGVYYARVDFEPSPLNRVLKSYAPGNSWAKNDMSTVERGGNKPVEQQFLVNTIADSVRIWNMSAGNAIPISSAGEIYGAGQLYKNITIDEVGDQVVEYKDKDGRVILKKVQIIASPGSAHVGWLCTYYIYDDLGSLRFVIPPRAMELINSSWVISAAISHELCFQYEYDVRLRMIIKKVPGAGPVHLVYDARDRLVFTQDSVQRVKTPTKEWLVIFYDELNRQVMTALYPSNSTREELQTVMNGVTSGSSILNYTIPGPANLVIGNRENGVTSYKATTSIVFQAGFESELNAEFTAEIDETITAGTTIVTVSNPFPNITGYTPLTYTFYDDYSYTGKHNAEPADFTMPQAGNNPYAEPVMAVSNITRGQITGTKVKVLGTTDQWLSTTTYYDDKGRAVQLIADNVGGGKDVTTQLYDFSGMLLSSYQRHKNPRSGATQQTTLLTMNRYDATGKLHTVKKRINDDAALERTITGNNYDELGQLKEKRLGVTGTATEWEKLSYEYNIRGWLKGINKTYATTVGSTTNWFGQELSYDYGFQENQYNGNIGGMQWKSKGDGVARAYGFNYDQASRLKHADFNQKNTDASNNWEKNLVDFTVSNLAYDANGNIASMKQMGQKASAPVPLDQLRYAYYEGSNRLRFVRDSVNDVSSILGDFKEPVVNNSSNSTAASSDFDYNYDGNGNLILDKNKDIASIIYNHLNLPQVITITGKGSISYLYDAAGTKMKKTVIDNTLSPARTSITDYIGGLVYEEDTLRLISHEEGRIRTVFQTGQPLQYKYDYFIKDHLGNIRVVLTEQTDLSMYVATMEQQSAAKEDALFSNIESSRSAKPVGYPEGEAATDKNEFVAKLNAKDPNKKIGPSLVLKVMAGDTVQIGAKAFYKSTGLKKSKSTLPAADMAAALAQALTPAALGILGQHGQSTASRNQSPFNENFVNNQYQRLKDKEQNPDKDNRPKAYLNFVLFDEQFNLVEENSGVRQVKAEPDQLQLLSQGKMVVEKSGFLYVYTSNESQEDVFFDDVTVMGISGALLEETHYYPFGLTMSGISSKAVGKLENKKRFNGYEQQNNEFSDGSGLEWYDYKNRFYDNQIGRFFCVDRLASDYPYYTPYQFAGNEVPNAIDLDGLEPHRFNKRLGAEFPAGDNLPMRVSPGDYLSGTGAAAGAADYRSIVADIIHEIIEPPLTALNTLVTGRKANGEKATLGDKVEAGFLVLGSLPTKGGTKGPGPMVKGRAPLGEMPSGSLLEMSKTFPDNATVVRGGISTPEKIATGTGTHSSGYTGISVECSSCTVKELSVGIPNNQIGVTTVGDVRAAGGNVIKTSGFSPYHGTLIGLTPEASSTLFNPPIRNPNKPIKQ